MGPPIQASVSEGLARVTLCRPETRNALSLKVAKAIRATVEALSQDDSVRVVVLCAEVPAYCAGADLTQMALSTRLSAEENEREIGQLAEVFLALYECPKPTIARVQGAAYG